MHSSITELEWEISKISNAINPEVQERLLELLDKPYRYAKISVSNLESNSMKYNSFYVLQLVKVLDHIVTALIGYPRDKEEQLKILKIAEDRLKRISVESLEAYVTEQFSSVVKALKKPRMYYRLAFFSLPEKSKIEVYVEDVKHNLLRGFQLRDKVEDWELCLMELEEALEGVKILKNLLPDADRVRYRFFVTLISITATVVSITIAVASYYI